MSYRDRLVRFYEHYNPEKLRFVDKSLEDYRGREEQMMQKLVEKYGPEPRSNTNTNNNNGYRARLVAYYEKYNPEKISGVDKALECYRGREEEMFTTLVAKYGPEPPAPATRGVYRSRLIAFYKKYCPEKLAIVDKALDGYAGREEAMFQTLVAKYGPEPVPPTREEYRQRLIRFYDTYCPDKIAIVDKALDGYAGREEAMFETLVAKYGPEPAHVTRETYMARLVLFYECYCPDKLDIVDKALDGYAGREEEMFQKLVAKYGPEPTPHEFKWVTEAEKYPVRCRTCENYFDITPEVVKQKDKAASCKACWFYLCPKCANANKLPGEDFSYRIGFEEQFEVLLAKYIAKDMDENSCQPMVLEFMEVVSQELHVRAHRRSFWKMIQGRMNYSSYVDMDRAREQKYRGQIMETLAGMMVIIAQRSHFNPPKDLWPDHPEAVVDGSDDEDDLL